MTAIATEVAAGSDVIAAVCGSRLFAGAAPDDVARLLPRLRVGFVPPGTDVFAQGDAADGHLYLVVTGRIVLSRHIAGGARRIVAVHGPSSVFGELSLVDSGPREATATAVTASVVAGIHRDDVDAFFVRADEPSAGQPSAGEPRAALAQLLAERVRQASFCHADTARDATARVARVVRELTQQFGVWVAESLTVEHGLTQAQVADYAGVSRESLNRALRGFERRGWLALGRKSFVVVDAHPIWRHVGWDVGERTVGSSQWIG